MEGIAATEVEGQRAHTLQVEVALQSDVGEETSLGHAEIVVVTFRIPLGRDIEAENHGRLSVMVEPTAVGDLKSCIWVMTLHAGCQQPMTGRADNWMLNWL